MRKLDFIRLNTVLHHEEPPTHPLFGAMKPMAARNLNDSQRLVLNEFKQPIPDFITGLEDGSELPQRDSQGGGFDLDHRFRGYKRRPEQLQATHQALMANESDLCGIPVPRFRDGRGDA